jgi:integrase
LKTREDGRIFPWPHTFKHLETIHKENLRAAGILPLAEYGMHTFRRAIGSALYEICPPAAGLLLRHAGGVTVQHYVQTISRVRGQQAVLGPILRRIATKHPGL